MTPFLSEQVEVFANRVKVLYYIVSEFVVSFGFRSQCISTDQDRVLLLKMKKLSVTIRNIEIPLRF